MSQVERVGISLDKKLLGDFDKMIKAQGYNNRSEAVRDLIRDKLLNKKLSNDKAKVTAAVCIAYNHHSTELMHKLTSMQHDHLLETICSMHVHLDRHDCMEIIVLKGTAGQINKMADKIISTKGVKFGQTNMIAS